MKTVYINKYGDSEVLEYGELPVPSINDNEILVKISATSVNPVDWKVRKGMLRFLPGQRLPKLLGGDFAGTVEKIGTAITQYKIGDEVYGLITATRGGAYAQYAIVKPHEMAFKPNNIKFVQAATIPLAALTAYQSLKKLGKIKSGEQVLVNGCSGGVGHFAIQIAKAMGAHVTGVCSEKNIEMSKSLGADRIIDYTKQEIFTGDIKYDIFFDAVANQSFWKVKKYLNKNGRYITTLPSFSVIINSISGIFSTKKGKIISVKSNSEDLRFISELIKSNKLKTVIDRTYNLDDIREAHRYSETGRVIGKLAIKILQD